MIANLDIDLQVFLEAFMDHPGQLLSFSGVPADARVVGAEIDHYKNVLRLKVQTEQDNGQGYLSPWITGHAEVGTIELMGAKYGIYSVGYSEPSEG